MSQVMSQNTLQSYVNDFIIPRRRARLHDEWMSNFYAFVKLQSFFHNYRMIDRLSDPDDKRYDFVLYKCTDVNCTEFVVKRERLLGVKG